MRRIGKILLLTVVLSILISKVALAEEAVFDNKTNKIKVGSYIQFGNYYNEPILWRVINIDKDGNPLLFSEYIIDLKEFDNKGSSDWVESSIREWLNNEKDGFININNFTELEINKIKYTYHQANLGEENSERIKPIVIQYVTDRVFLLSTVEISKHFGNDMKSTITKPTEAAVKNHINEFVHLNKNKYWNYFLRTPFTEANYGTSAESVNTTYMGEEGSYIVEKKGVDTYTVIQYFSNLVRNISSGSVFGESYYTGSFDWNHALYKGGIRPALYLNGSQIKSYQLNGNGTTDNPYTIDTTSKESLSDISTDLESSHVNRLMEIESVETTISKLEIMRTTENRVSKTLIKEMASGLLELEAAIRTSGAEVTEEVFAILDRAEGALKGVPATFTEVQDAKKVIEKVRISFGVAENITEDNKDAAVELSDISFHWGKKYIDNLVARGGISGYPDGTFKPDQAISKSEFVAIAVKSALNGQVADKTDNHWASGIFKTAREKQVLLLNDFPKVDWDKPITRYEMSYVMVRITENILGEERTSAAGVENIMSDYKQVSGQQKYKYYVEQAFMKGLVTGKTADGLYDGNANGTRAEAATMVVRMLDKSIREIVDINKAFVGTEKAKAVFDQIPTYHQKTNHGLMFGDKGYTLDDVAVFAKGYLSTSWNYDATDKASMDIWEKEVFKYVTTGSQADVTKNKQKFIDTKDICKSDIYVDASKIEIKNGNFIVHAVAYDHVTGKTFKVDLTIGGHNVNKSEIAVGLWKINEVK